eukprot:g1877.t1
MSISRCITHGTSSGLKKSPWRYVLRNLGRILSFLVVKFSKVCTSFNLNDLSLTYGRDNSKTCRRKEAFQASKTAWSVAGGQPKYQIGTRSTGLRPCTFHYGECNLHATPWLPHRGVYISTTSRHQVYGRRTRQSYYHHPEATLEVFFGIRKVDDLLTALPPNHPVVARLLSAIRNSGAPLPIDQQFYTGGLELEEEKTVTRGQYHFLVFAGYDLAIPIRVDIDF